VQTLRGATHWFELPGALAQGVGRLARKERASLFMTLLAAFQTLLYRYTGQDDICVGTPVANRNRPEIEPLIGFFVNTLVLRGDLSGNPTFRQLLRRVRQVALGAYAHQDVPFEMLVDELSVARDMSRTPLFQVMFTVQDAPMESLRIPGLTLSPLATDSGAAKFDLILTVVKKRTALRASLEYNTDLFDAATIERMAGHFRALVEGIVATPDAPIAALPLLTADERAQLLYAWNATEAEYAHTQTIPALFARQAARTPDAVAVVYQGESLTYGELNRRANQLAHHLQTLGVGPEVLVGLCVERSVDMLVGLMGILKAGGAYVPLDPSYPPERLAYMLTDASVPVLLTQGRLLAQLPTFAGETVCLDRDWAAIARQPEQEPDSLVGPENLAYVIYTSGSTGKPKGTMVSHRSALNLAAALREQIYTHLPRRPLRVSLNAPLSFDASAQEWLMLLYGDALHVIPQDMRLDGDALVRYVREQQLDVLDCVPSQLKLLLGAGLLAEGEWVPGAVLPGGEAIDPATWAVLRQAPSTEFYNMYGPTECTVDSTIGWVRACGERPSIGKPVSNARLYVLDGQGEPVPVGVPGELYIGGAGVSRGYLQRPELTAERFVPDPFSGEPGARLYRTGDRVRYLPDGNVEFLGRLDDQVKLRGYRIELGEIEAVLREQAGIRDAVVLVREDQPGHQRLVAYVVPEGQPPSIAELRAQLGHTLPEYMVPSTYVFLEAFPLTPNAKVDRRALPAPEAARPDLESDYVAPRTPEEQIMAGIWAQVLGVEQVGVYDNFFELGGDSILSIQVVARANQAGLRISPRQVFQYPTVAALAAVAGKWPQVQAEQGVVTGAVPLTPIQRHFFAQNLPNPHHWNQAVLLEVREALDPDLLRRTVQHLMAHHDALRLRFHRTAEGWQQTNADLDGRVPFSLVDLSGVPEGEQQAAIEREATRLQSSLHLTEGPLWQVAYMRLGDGRPGRLLLVAHHLTIDGVSWRVLFEDLQTVYRQLQQGQPLALPLKTTSFRQWASRLEEYARRDALREQLRYWQSLGEGVYPLPVDWPEGANTEASAEWVRGGLTEDETVALLRDVPAAYGTEINDALLTALAQAFRERTGVPSLLVDLEGHGRESLFDDVDLSRTVGWFTALYPVRLDLGMIEHPGEALKAIKEQLRGIPQRGLGYGLLRYLGDDRAALQALPQAQVSFNYLGQFELGLNDALLAPARESAGPERDPAATRAYLLDISASVRGGRLQVDWLYSRNQYRRETIEALAEGYLRALRELVAHCQSPEAGGYTASDFPEASLDQQELDEILLELKEASGDE
jgi:amino acid adenylation domain-containing protein/non-ribosomal peptide synthase protein (TIGR01720 family)